MAGCRRSTAAIDGIEGMFEIDTGSRGSLTLAPAFVAKNGLEKKLAPKNEAITGAGIGRPVRSLLARGKMLKLGTVEVPNPVIAIPQAAKATLARPKSPATSASAFMRQFAVTYDLPNDALYFERYLNFGTPDIADRGGLWLERGDGRLQGRRRGGRGPGGAGRPQGGRRDRRGQRPRVVGGFAAGAARCAARARGLARAREDGRRKRSHARAARPGLTALSAPSNASRRRSVSLIALPASANPLATHSVIPANAGIQRRSLARRAIPAFAGKTIVGIRRRHSGRNRPPAPNAPEAA